MIYYVVIKRKPYVSVRIVNQYLRQAIRKKGVGAGSNRGRGAQITQSYH